MQVHISKAFLSSTAGACMYKLWNLASGFLLPSLKFFIQLVYLLQYEKKSTYNIGVKLQYVAYDSTS